MDHRPHGHGHVADSIPMVSITECPPVYQEKWFRSDPRRRTKMGDVAGIHTEELWLGTRLLRQRQPTVLLSGQQTVVLKTKKLAVRKHILPVCSPATLPSFGTQPAEAAILTNGEFRLIHRFREFLCSVPLPHSLRGTSTSNAGTIFSSISTASSFSSRSSTVMLHLTFLFPCHALASCQRPGLSSFPQESAEAFPFALRPVRVRQLSRRLILPPFLE